MVRIGIVGAAGYVGGELIRLLSSHPDAEITFATSERLGGTPLSYSWPQLSGTKAGALTLEELDAARAAERCDAVFVALPHTRSMDAVADLVAAGVTVIDMSADYRLGEASLYERVYGEAHRHPGLLSEAVYGLPELLRHKIKGAKLIASPGCYPTATLMALLPLAKYGYLGGGSAVIVDAKSGVSGAGRIPSENTHYAQVNENFTAYKVGEHRHAPEIELYLGAAALAGGGDHAGGYDAAGDADSVTPPVLFVPYLVPMDRGILATVYVSAPEGMGLAELRELYEETYEDEEFVTILPEGMSPQTKAVRGSNYCHLGLFYHEVSGQFVVISAIDNLVKGAAGQGVQAMNIALGLDEGAGLRSIGLLP